MFISERTAGSFNIPGIGRDFESLHSAFSAVAQTYPDSIALKCGEHSITYRGLDEQSDWVAANLAKELPQGQKLAALCMDRSINYCIALLGILKAGATCLPLPAEYPAWRKNEIIYSSKPSLIFNDKTFASFCRQTGREGLSAIMPNKIAFVLSSSGSTGKPKLIKKSHGSLIPRMKWAWESAPYRRDEVCCQKSHMTTTHSIYELFEPLLAGASVVIVSDSESRDPGSFWPTIERNKIGRLLIVPSMLRASIAARTEFPDLHTLILMGEPVSGTLAQELVQIFKSAQIHSVYGTTETGSFLSIDLGRARNHGESFILGRPIHPEIKTKILDDHGREVQIGEVGLLHVEGLSVEGYLDSTLQTKSRLYNTLDRVRTLHTGDLEYLGRSDQTAKVRGFRVDLQEVEQVIESYPGIQQAAALVNCDPAGGDVLMAYVTPNRIDVAGLWQHIKSRLPSYMVPSAVLVRQNFPLTLSGKLDRERLKQESLSPDPSMLSARFSTDLGEKIAELWKSVLPLRNFDMHTNFFETGGSSLSAFRLIAELRRQFPSVQISPQMVYANPTILALSELIEKSLTSSSNHNLSSESLTQVSLKAGKNHEKAPLFLIASAGGALGPYTTLVKALDIDRDIVGIRDPFLFGARDATASFQDWVKLYVEAIRSRQPRGPYYLCGFSSASIFVHELALQLKAAGEEIGQLFLIDPVSMGLAIPGSRGQRATVAALSSKRYLKWSFVFQEYTSRLSKWIFKPRPVINDYRITGEKFEQLKATAKANSRFVWNFGLSIELDTGVNVWPSDLGPNDKSCEELWGILKEKLKSAFPDVAEDYFESVFVQYYCLHGGMGVLYRYLHQGQLDSLVVFEVERPVKSVLYHFFRPLTKKLEYHSFSVDRTSRTMNIAARVFGPKQNVPRAYNLDYTLHMGCMRDEQFVSQVAARIQTYLKAG